MASGIRSSMALFMSRFSGFSDPKRGNVIVVQKSDDSLWGCLRSKPCVCTFVTFFLLEIIVVGVAAGIYFTQNDSFCAPDETAQWYVRKYFYNILCHFYQNFGLFCKYCDIIP